MSCRLPLAAALLNQIGRALAGIEIHPGARIGHSVFIDHGMGVVIGETAEIGNRCLLYGASPWGHRQEHGKRHPLAENVVVGAEPRCWGDHDRRQHPHRRRIGGVQYESDCTVVGIPGRVIHQSGGRINPGPLRLPDAEAR